MSPTPRRRRKAAPDPFPEHGLAELGLAPGDAVRFRRTDGERWKPATVARRERDGSVGLHDSKGASRAIPVDRIEVRGTGPRGGVVWEPLTERAARTEQLALVRNGRSPAADRGPATARGRDRSTEPSPPDPAPARPAPARRAPGATDDASGEHGTDDDGQLRLL